MPKGAMNTHRNVMFTRAGLPGLDATPGRDGRRARHRPAVPHHRADRAHRGEHARPDRRWCWPTGSSRRWCSTRSGEHRPTFTIGAITAFIALMNAPGFTARPLRVVHPALLRRARRSHRPPRRRSPSQFGHPDAQRLRAHRDHARPRTACRAARRRRSTRRRARCRSACRSLNTIVRIQDDDGHGRCRSARSARSSPTARRSSPGYWDKPEETGARTCPAGALKTGDVGFMDAEGWFFIVDRKKDMINASRLQGLAARGRGRARRAPGGARGGRRRRARREARRDGEGVRQR